MRLSWNEIPARAADFAGEWADAAYKKGETQKLLQRAFFEIFGVSVAPSPGTKSTSSGSTTRPASSTCSGRACCWSNRRAPTATNVRRPA